MLIINFIKSNLAVVLKYLKIHFNETEIQMDNNIVYHSCKKFYYRIFKMTIPLLLKINLICFYKFKATLSEWFMVF